MLRLKCLSQYLSLTCLLGSPLSVASSPSARLPHLFFLFTMSVMSFTPVYDDLPRVFSYTTRFESNSKMIHSAEFDSFAGPLLTDQRRFSYTIV